MTKVEMIDFEDEYLRFRYPKGARVKRSQEGGLIYYRIASATRPKRMCVINIIRTSGQARSLAEMLRLFVPLDGSRGVRQEIIRQSGLSENVDENRELLVKTIVLATNQESYDLGVLRKEANSWLWISWTGLPKERITEWEEMTRSMVLKQIDTT